MNSSSNSSAIRTLLALCLVSSLTTGCYLLESAEGQLSLMAKREPIERIIERPSTTAALRTQLEAVTSIRDFASHDLGLPDNGSYRSYADIGRSYVVWNVVAAPEFSMDPKQWCFPIVGCVAYRGYFVEHRAQKFAADLHEHGFDVAVGGVAAYSTLGHFDDPIINTMLGWDDIELASIIFHELTHQLLYVAGDGSFNEALATTVEEEGVRRWLLAQGRDADLRKHELQQRHYLEVIELLRSTSRALQVIYASGLDAKRMREAKREQFAALHESYAHLKAQWGGRAPFADWFHADLNNAYLASIATYYDCVPGFERELAATHGNLDAFYRRVHELAKLNAEARDAAVCGKPVV